MSKIVIFCENYTEIESTLYVAKHHCHDSLITIVIPGFHDLLKFFQVINEKVFHSAINIIYLESYQPGRAQARGINKIPHVIPDIIRERRYLKEIWNKYFVQLAGCEVFFFSRGSSGFKFYLLKKLSKRHRLVYISHGPPYFSKYTPTNIVDLASLTISKLIYGRDAAVGKLPYIKGFLYIPDKFMKKEVDRVIDWTERNKIMKDFDLSQFRIFDAGKYSVIYFDEGLLERGFVTDKTTFSRELAKVFDVLGKYFPEKEIARKYHPGHDSDQTLIKVGDILPAFIPAELLYNENVKMYIGICSASIANVEKGLAVSIADLITFKNDEIRKGLKEGLIQMSKSRILFPKSLDEFEQIIIDMKQ